MAFRLFSPEGPPGLEPLAVAPLPASLRGARIAVLDNRKPGARLLMQTMAERLASRTGARVSLLTEKGNAAVQAPGELLDRVRGEADVVLTGSGD